LGLKNVALRQKKSKQKKKKQGEKEKKEERTEVEGSYKFRQLYMSVVIFIPLTLVKVGVLLNNSPKTFSVMIEPKARSLPKQV
jgi:hypothetical protein